MKTELKLLNDDHNYFYTYDLGLAAALVSCGYNVESIDRESDKKVMFIFERKNNIGKAIDDYWNGKLKVVANSYLNNIKLLKNRIYSY